ncbi:MAG: DNA replication/repair protein RecF [Dehalococcoidia bacterium]
MYLENLSLTNFRNYSSLDLALGPGPLVLWGDNAQGKSNLLEAIFLLATTKSARTGSDRELVRWEALNDPFAVTRIVGEVRRGGDSIRLEVALAPDSSSQGAADPAAPIPSFRKQTRINGVPRRASDVVGQLNAVIFSALDVDLVAGPPSQRRRYIDLTNSQVDRPYLRALQRYGRVLTQRNHLLRLIREGKGQREELSFWDRQLVDEGSYIYMQRRAMIQKLAGLAGAIYSELTGGAESFEMIYLPNPSGLAREGGESEDLDQIKEMLRNHLAFSLDREVAQGATVVGPHRDDLQFLVDARDMGLYGSRGQQRTIAAALKLAEANFLMRKTGEDPVLLLDDILSELDALRRQQVMEVALSNQQTILTTTDLDRVDRGFLSRATVLKVEGGRLSSVSTAGDEGPVA